MISKYSRITTQTLLYVDKNQMRLRKNSYTKGRAKIGDILAGVCDIPLQDITILNLIMGNRVK